MRVETFPTSPLRATLIHIASHFRSLYVLEVLTLRVRVSLYLEFRRLEGTTVFDNPQFESLALPFGLNLFSF